MSKTLIFVGIAAAAIAAGFLLSRSPQPATTPAPSEETESAKAHAAGRSAGEAEERRARSSAAARPPKIEASDYASKIISGLTNVSLTDNKLAPGQAEQLRQGFQQLAAQGAAALPVIREMLQTKQDVSFGKGSGETVGAPTLRLGLMDTLKNIEGPEAVAMSRQLLQTSTDPQEIALLTRNLEQAGPGQFRDESLNTVAQALGALEQSPTNGADVGPLFQALQSYGGTNVATYLEKLAPKWNYYATLGLAGLPDGQGIPALTRMAMDNSVTGVGNRAFALQMLAQVSSQYPDAGSALVDMAKQNMIGDSAWRQIADVLAGLQYQFPRGYPDNMFTPVDGPGLRTYSQASGNQTFVSTLGGGDAVAATSSQRLALIDQLLGANPSPAAADALRQARARLATK